MLTALIIGALTSAAANAWLCYLLITAPEWKDKDTPPEPEPEADQRFVTCVINDNILKGHWQ